MADDDDFPTGSLNTGSKMEMGKLRRSETDDFPTANIPQSGNRVSTGDSTGDSIRPSSQRASQDYRKANMGAAREYFEFHLPKRIVDAKQPSGYRKALPGELRSMDGGNEAVESYTVCNADAQQMNEFGTGISLYFKTLKLLFAVIFVCAFISLVAIQENVQHAPDDLDNEYMLGTAYGSTRADLKFNHQGASDIVVTLLLLLLFFVAGYLQDSFTNVIDEQLLTSNDYSVIMYNPPKNLTDPQDYYNYFSRFGDVALITVAMNNGDLITALANKKELEMQETAQMNYKHIAENNGDEYVDQDQVGCIQKFIQDYLGYLPTLGSVKQMMLDNDKRIASLKHSDYKPWRVLCTYNTESDADKCLKETAITLWEKWFGAHGIDSSAKMQETTVHIGRAREPDDIEYESSGYSWQQIYFWLGYSYAITAAIMVIVYFIVDAMASVAALVAVFISIVNAILPEVVNYLTYYVEVHYNRSDRQRSALLKLLVVRCMNSAILIYLATPFSDRFDEKTLEHVLNILIADAISTPIIRILDLPGQFRRHVLVKYVATQDEMNLMWAPGNWSLAERYTDMMKTLFVGLYYAVPVPAGLFVTAFAMVSTYFVDKYSLFKLWKVAPNYDASLATVSRYMLAFVIYAHVTSSQRYFANWPFDGDKADCGFFICLPNGQMTDQQQQLTRTYNGLNLTLFIVAVGYVLYKQVGSALYACCFSLKEAGAGNLEDDHYYEDDQGRKRDTTFRHMEHLSAYIPMINHENLPEPLLFTDLTKIPEKYSPIASNEWFGGHSPQNKEGGGKKRKIAHDMDLEGVSPEGLIALFGSIMYFEKKEEVRAQYHSQQSTMRSAMSGGGAVGAVGAASPAPPVSRPPAMTTSSTSGSTSGSGDLPPGWTQLRAMDGKVYYSNNLTKKTSWDRPTE
jgi:hypothetical protein